jgi:hypothetical protein
LSDHVTGELEIEAAPGDTVLIDVRADLGRYSAAGLSLFVQVPEGFGVLEEEGGVPFLAGALFEDGVVVRNGVVEQSMLAGGRLLEYAVLLGPGGRRSRTGAGRVACFRLLCPRQTSGEIELHHSPVHESRLVLEDGRTERSFFSAAPLQITVDVAPQTSVEPTTWAVVKALPAVPSQPNSR